MDENILNYISSKGNQSGRWPAIILEEPELYNLRSDFSEKYDVALNHPRL